MLWGGNERVEIGLACLRRFRSLIFTGRLAEAVFSSDDDSSIRPPKFSVFEYLVSSRGFPTIVVLDEPGATPAPTLEGGSFVFDKDRREMKRIRLCPPGRFDDTTGPHISEQSTTSKHKKEILWGYRNFLVSAGPGWP